MNIATQSALRSLQLALFLILGIALSGCATIKSGSHYDESASFVDYKTYSWIAEQPLIVGAGQQADVDPLTQKKIVKAIEAELANKGFVQAVNQSSTDFVLSFTVGTRDRIDVASYPRVYQGAWGGQLYGRYYYEMEVEHRMYTEGTLGVDVFDGRSKQPVWHGWATKTISSSDRENPAPSIEKAVVALFKDFPPSTRVNQRPK